MPVALVTGAAGQDGGYLCERLLSDGLEVHGVVTSTQPEDVPPWLSGVSLHTLDLSDTGALAGLVHDVAPDEVYNLAAVSSVAASWDEPVRTSEVNALAVAVLLDASWRLQERAGHAVRVVQASSAEIFGRASEVPQTERTAIAPVNPYGVAKAFAHQLSRVYRARGLHVSACVLYNHESPRRPPAFVTRKITKTVSEIARGRSDRLVLGSLDVRRDWGWAPDYVDAMVRAARAKSADDYVVATGEAHTVEEFVAAAFAAAGIDEWRHMVGRDARFVRPAEASVQVGDASLARAALGWAPSVGFTDIVRRMVEADLDELDAGSAPGRR